MTKNKEQFVKVEALCTSMTGEFRDTNEDNFYFNGQYMDSDGGIALRLTSGDPEEVEPEEEEQPKPGDGSALTDEDILLLGYLGRHLGGKK